MRLISKHLDESKIKPKAIEGIDTVCAFSGVHITRGYLKKEVIKTTFNDRELLRFDSDYISPEYALLIENFDGRIGLRNFSFFASEKELLFLKREDILELLLNIPDAPFRIGVTYGGKKHIAYKSVLNMDKKDFQIITDIGEVHFTRSAAEKIIAAAQKWYTVIPEKAHTSAQPTYFTKDEIKGLKIPIQKKIKTYGIAKYFKEEKELSLLRGTPLFNLIIHILNKQIL